MAYENVAEVAVVSERTRAARRKKCFRIFKYVFFVMAIIVAIVSIGTLMSQYLQSLDESVENLLVMKSSNSTPADFDGLAEPYLQGGSRPVFKRESYGTGGIRNKPPRIPNIVPGPQDQPIQGRIATPGDAKPVPFSPLRPGVPYRPFPSHPHHQSHHNQWRYPQQPVQIQNQPVKTSVQEPPVTTYYVTVSPNITVATTASTIIAPVLTSESTKYEQDTNNQSTNMVSGESYETGIPLLDLTSLATETPSVVPHKRSESVSVQEPVPTDSMSVGSNTTVAPSRKPEGLVEDKGSDSRSFDSEMIAFAMPTLATKSPSLLTSNSATKKPAVHCGFTCADGKTCLDARRQCDGHVQCPDGSDEIGCNCTSRLVKARLCDDNYDCPDKEDENWGCGGCASNEFSCKEGSAGNMAFNEKECVLKAALCDGNQDCSTGKDEQDCYRLASVKKDVRGVLSKGLLQKMIHGDWYFICKRFETATVMNNLGVKVCNSIVGDLQKAAPKVSVTFGTSEEYKKLDYAFTGATEAAYSISSQGCPTRQLIMVECPPPSCGWPVSKYKSQDGHRRNARSVTVLEDVESSDVALEELANLTRHERNRYYEEDQLTSKVVGGTESLFGKWPFMCAIYRNGIFICGASIIHEKWVLTAAHCTHGYEKYVYEVQCGMTRRYSYSPTEQSRRVIGVYPHERYNNQIFSNDIAMMELESELHLSIYVTTACPSFSSDADPVPDKDKCHVIGWGNLEEDGSTPDHLQEALLPVKECNEAFTRSTIQICAGFAEGKIDACQGDSGGPFVCSDQLGRQILVGLVSFGRGCARPGKLGVYTRVSAYINWIDSIIDGTNTFHKGSTSHTAKPPERSCFRPGGHYIFDKFTCDRNVDCIDADEEINCSYTDTSPDAYSIDVEGHESNHNNDTAARVGNPLNGKHYDCSEHEFQCKSTEECISKKLVCNRIRDCPDGSDEFSCSCAAVIESTEPWKFCDGLPDCNDLDDEQNCNKCPNTEERHVPCPLSNGTCIAASNWCDGYPHCKYGEDEVDCIMIGKTKKVPEASFLAAKVSRHLTSGYVFIRNAGLQWTPACAEDFGTDVKDLVCPYMGFSETATKSYKRSTAVYQERVRPKARSFEEEEDSNCTPLRVTCYDTGMCGERRLFTFANDLSHLTHQPGAFPWDAIVLVDGEKRCAAVMIDRKWGVASASCLQITAGSLKKNYVSLKAGAYPSSTITSGPMEQVKRVNSLKAEGGVVLLHTDKAFSTDYFTTPLCYGSEGFPLTAAATASCIATKLNIDLTLDHVPVKVTSTGCPGNADVCVEVDKDCQGLADSLVYCTIDAKNITSWYFLGHLPLKNSAWCSSGLKQISLYSPFVGPNAEKWQTLITKSVGTVTPPPTCNGVRCPYGTCLDKSKTCDRIADCSNGQDEGKCQQQYSVLRSFDDDYYPSNGTCPTGYFRCESTFNCVPISAFCDGVYDCGTDDLTDEPDGQCDCKSYLSLVDPGKVCDAKGVLDCPDRSDEHDCLCSNKHQFQCIVGNKNSCIQANLVCDGYPDCKYGEDEKSCTTLSTSLLTLMENKTVASFTGFVLLRVKNQWHPYCSDDWSIEVATSVCQQQLGYKHLERAPQLFELEHVRGLREEERVKEAERNGGSVQDSSETSLLVLRKDADLRGPYDYKDQATGNNCYVAFISCAN